MEKLHKKQTDLLVHKVGGVSGWLLPIVTAAIGIVLLSFGQLGILGICGAMFCLGLTLLTMFYSVDRTEFDKSSGSIHICHLVGWKKTYPLTDFNSVNVITAVSNGGSPQIKVILNRRETKETLDYLGGGHFDVETFPFPSNKDKIQASALGKELSQFLELPLAIDPKLELREN